MHYTVYYEYFYYALYIKAYVNSYQSILKNHRKMMEVCRPEKTGTL